MPRRLLPAALLVVVACALALVVAMRGEDQPASGPGALDRDAIASALSQTGQGPAGSAIVTLSRWRYRADPDNRGRDSGWARGDWPGTPVQVPYSPNTSAFSGAAGQRAYDGSVGWFATDIDAPVAGRYAVRFESAHFKATIFVDGEPVREHVGAYEPFTARVPLQRGRHTIVDARRLARPAAPGRQRLGARVVQLRRPEPAGDADAARAQRARGADACARG